MNIFICFKCVYYIFIITIVNAALSIIYCYAFGDPSTKVCYNLNESTLNYSSSCTPYKFTNSTVGQSELPVFPGCVPVKIWLLIRHGSRTPNPKTVNLMKVRLPDIRHHILYAHKNGKGDLPEKTIHMFKNWSGLPLGEPKSLTSYGKREMYELAKRFQNLFPQLLPASYSSNHYSFRHTMSRRTKQSAVHFGRGLFDSNEVNSLTLADSLNDRITLKFQKHCRKWLKKVKRNLNHLGIRDKFMTGSQMKQMQEELTHRLGLNETLLIADIRLMFLACAAEFASTGAENSPWCYLFSKKDLELLEYSLDLKHYLRDSYGHKLNYEQACPIVKDMMDYITDNSKRPPAIISFTHFGTMSKLFAALKMYYDETPLSSKLIVDRKYRLSKIAPFSTNFAIVVYKCNNINEKKVLVLHQERPITLPGCPENELCPISILESNYNETRNNCNFDEICGNKKMLDQDSKSNLSAIKDIVRKVISLL